MAKSSFSELQKMQAEVLQSLADIKDIKAMDGLMAKLKKVKEEIGNYEKERTATIGEISKAIVESDVKLYELSPEAQKQLSSVKSKSTKNVDGAAPKAPRKKKSGTLLFQIKGAGAPTKWNESQDFPQFAPVKLKALYEQDKANFPKALEEYCTPEGKAYFESATGKAALKEIVSYLDKTDVQKKSPKK